MIASLAGGCVIPYAIPPLRGETGAVSTSGGRKPAIHAAAGAHLASATLDRDQPFDLGIGGFADWTEGGLETKGIYTDAAVFVERTRRTRTSVGVRGELRWDTVTSMEHGGDRFSKPGVGAKLRIDHEIYGTTTKPYGDADGCAMIVGSARGTGAIGVYAEAGHAWLGGSDNAFVATAGITLRIPATAGIYAGIPNCK